MTFCMRGSDICTS